MSETSAPAWVAIEKEMMNPSQYKLSLPRQEGIHRMETMCVLLGTAGGRRISLYVV